MKPSSSGFCCSKASIQPAPFSSKQQPPKFSSVVYVLLLFLSCPLFLSSSAGVQMTAPSTHGILSFHLVKMTQSSPLKHYWSYELQYYSWHFVSICNFIASSCCSIPDQCYSILSNSFNFSKFFLFFFFLLKSS